jgi:threonine synthase
MDILVSSNLERLLYEFTESDETTASWMKELNENGIYQVDQNTLSKMQSIFHSGYCNDEDCAEWIKKVYEKDHYVMDPHTACGYKVLKDYINQTKDEHNCILLSTASPFKFCKDVLTAITSETFEDEWQCMNELEKISGHPAPVQLQLKDAPVLHDALLALDEVKDMLTEMVSEETL